MQEQILFAGFGGQGVMFVGMLVAYAAMDEGREVTWIPSYGPEMRGGTAHCFVVISDRPIGSPVVRRPGAAVVFNTPSFEKYEPLVAPAGLLVRNASLITQCSQRADITELGIGATEIADELGSPRLVNMVLLGATLVARPCVSLLSVSAALEKHLPEHHRDLLSLDREALQRGVEAAKQLLVLR
jgi:2-oxoglutarate ferredoxin oxidoreductase subunit gamma